MKQASYDEFGMFLKQGTIKYHTKPEDAAVKLLRTAQQSVKIPMLLESV
jgi:hypothetical protein